MSKTMSLGLCACLALHALVARADAQSTTPLRFEVETIKRNTSDGPAFLATTNDRFSATNFSLRLLIQNAFRLKPNQLVGGPGWLDDHYDIIAKSPEPLTGDRQREMIRSLLADRFKLATHMETRELPIYTLIVARSDGTLGPRMSVTKNDCASRTGRPLVPPASPSERPVCDWFGRTGSMIAGGIKVDTLAEMLSRNVGRQVIDRTGLTGFYDLDLSFNPDVARADSPPGAPTSAIDTDAPGLFTALQEQLGLKLEAGSGPVEVLVIDRIERPTLD